MVIRGDVGVTAYHLQNHMFFSIQFITFNNWNYVECLVIEHIYNDRGTEEGIFNKCLQ